MSHSLADYAYGDSFRFGCACLAVPRNIERQRDANAHFLGYLFQIVVDIVAGISVGATLIRAGIPYDGQKVVGNVFKVFVEYELHFLSPFNRQMLPGLATAVGNVAVSEVGLAQIGHIDEAHSTQYETHHEYIAGVIESRGQG